MTAMREKDMVRLLVESFPGDFFFILVKDPDLFFFRAVCDFVLMALDADRYGRHSREVLGFEVAMTGIAGQSLIFMFLVVEG